MRSRGSVKPDIPWLTDPVDKLEGLGTKTKANLRDVRACVLHIDARAVASVPAHAPNNITTGMMPLPHPPCIACALRVHSMCMPGTVSGRAVCVLFNILLENIEPVMLGTHRSHIQAMNAQCASVRSLMLSVRG